VLIVRKGRTQGVPGPIDGCASSRHLGRGAGSRGRGSHGRCFGG
jgi:hypothetical protein